MSERLIPGAITPMTQSSETGCVPTAISMVLSGFGTDVSEQILVERYFPTAKLPRIDRDSGSINWDSGVADHDIVRGMVRILTDMDLRNRLQIDVFFPHLWRYTSSPENLYIVKVAPKALREYGNRFDEDTKVRELCRTLEELVRKNEICVYSANARTMGLSLDYGLTMRMDNKVRAGFYTELVNFVSKGHIVGPHGGGTAHVRALDGSRIEKMPWSPNSSNEAGFLVVDPAGTSYNFPIHGLIWVDSGGVRGDLFDYLFRVSPRDDVLDPQQYGFRRFIQNLRHLIP